MNRRKNSIGIFQQASDPAKIYQSSSLRKTGMSGVISSATTHRVRSAVAMWAITSALGCVVVLGADFGLPVWIVIPTFLWLLTMGLPTTVGVVLTVSLWGVVPTLNGLGPFLCCSALVGLVAQVLCCVCVSHWFAKWHWVKP
jgi:hypothetical protein